MSAQTTYNFDTQRGIAGGIYDLAPYAIDTFLNEEATGTMKFGVAVVAGTKAGEQVKLPVAASTAIEGVSNNNLTTEYDLAGQLYIRQNASMGVMRYGRIWVRVADNVSPTYGQATYVVKGGAQAGYFTNASTDTLAVKGRFLTGVDPVARIAAVELFNQAQA